MQGGELARRRHLEEHPIPSTTAVTALRCAVEVSVRGQSQRIGSDATAVGRCELVENRGPILWLAGIEPDVTAGIIGVPVDLVTRAVEKAVGAGREARVALPADSSSQPELRVRALRREFVECGGGSPHRHAIEIAVPP